MARRFEKIRAAFIGSAGVPNRYGGFESFLEHCGPAIAARVGTLTVTCDASLYDERAPDWRGLRRRFIGIRANGMASIGHDFVAFLAVFPTCTHIIVLGVSGGVWFPLWRALCSLTGRRLLVNVDGVEYRRAKFDPLRRAVLKVFDHLAQRFAHVVIYDNPGLLPFVIPGARSKARLIAYSGDHVLRPADVEKLADSTLTVCRIEPENQIELIIEGVLASKGHRCRIAGNWDASPYGRELRERYAGHERVELLDPVYDAVALSRLRESCTVYIHAHSVGGTNPSLVEMMFYDCKILCFDCGFNRESAGDCALYFRNRAELARLLDTDPSIDGAREACRAQFTGARIADLYVEAMVAGGSRARREGP